MTSDRAYWLAWSTLTGIGPILLQRLQRHFGTLAAAWDAPAAALGEVDGFGRQTCDSILRERSQLDPAELLATHSDHNPNFWTPADPDYPRLLLEIPDPPPVLYYRGQVNPQENQGILPAIALVGTRSPSDYGRRWTQRLTQALTESGWTIISGLADGIDTLAHKTCLEAGGRTVAVVGTGVDIVYPSSNRALAQRILEQGLILSEYPAGTKPDRAHFPRRNRMIAGLSRATLVLEAPSRSGALITARLANDCGRDVYALPGSLDNERSLGCLELLNQGAQVVLGEADLLERLGSLPSFLPAPVEQLSLLPPPSLTPDLATILNAMSLEAIALDGIVQTTGLATGLVLGSLTQLEMMGLVTQLPGSRYQRC
ncbi:DNA-processing protein DprA [Leptolyngbya sp. CCY15150]|uniref:DNA-processing protein DprA n=1 Tax=Leptolyngbya sp. CCY15150 TaxID=2767772 RepID=UPI001950B77E|nr:DNA-processing protein DprA [Leptolyngbya sp. CCY15150]